MKITKENLIKQVAVLEADVKERAELNTSRRKTLGKLLGIYGEPSSASMYRSSASSEIPDWLDIAFAIGELKSDADFSIMLGEKERLAQQNQVLQMSLRDAEIRIRELEGKR